MCYILTKKVWTDKSNDHPGIVDLNLLKKRYYPGRNIMSTSHKIDHS
jgi:hypothetical protein